MQFTQNEEPDIKKPIIIAAMQDMGNVGSIVINFIKDSDWFDYINNRSISVKYSYQFDAL